MKKYLLLAFLFAAAGLTPVDAQTQNFRAGSGDSARERARRAPAPVYRRGPIGAFQRAARGNPIQMLNPRAPQKYFGPPHDTFIWDDPNNPTRITGLIFFGFRW